MADFICPIVQLSSLMMLKFRMTEVLKKSDMFVVHFASLMMLKFRMTEVLKKSDMFVVHFA